MGSATIVRSGMLRVMGAGRPAPSLFFLPGLKSHAWWERSALPQVELLERNVDVIRKEVRDLGEDAGSDYAMAQGEQKLHSGKWRWNSFVMKGQWQEEMVERCPETARILRELPDLMIGCPLSYCFFSTLAPGAKIAPHFGPSNLRVRCHLTLSTPEDSNKEVCGIRVGNETRAWKNGEALVFDDAYEHETWNLHPTQERVVLLIDFWHPELTLQERKAICEMFDSVKK